MKIPSDGGQSAPSVVVDCHQVTASRKASVSLQSAAAECLFGGDSIRCWMDDMVACSITHTGRKKGSMMTRLYC